MVATGDGLAILDQGLSLGGGALQNFGINSNTSANGFIKCLYKKQTNVVAIQAASPPPQKAMPAGSPVPQKLKNKNAGLEEGSDSDEEDLR